MCGRMQVLTHKCAIYFIWLRIEKQVISPYWRVQDEEKPLNYKMRSVYSFLALFVLAKGLTIGEYEAELDPGRITWWKNS